MNKNEHETASNRHYPPFWEKVIPIALGIIAVVIIILLFIIFAVTLGLFPG